MPELMRNGLIISSQNIAYAISKFIGGVLSDRLSSRLLFSSGLVVSGVATILFAQSDSIAVFAGLWFLNGLAQGLGWPACAKVLRQWFAPSQFGTFWSLLSASANISGGLSPFIAAFIIINYGWRTSLVMAGTVSIAMAGVAIVTVVNCPQDANLSPVVPKTNDNNKNKSKSETKWTDLLKSPFLWLVSVSYMSVFASKTSAVDWGQMYLIEDRHHSQIIGSSFTSSVESGGFFGSALAGYLTDLVLRRQLAAKTGAGDGKKSINRLTPSNARMPVAIAMMTVVGLCLHCFRYHITDTSSQLMITTLGFVLGACLYGPIAIFGVVASESAPPHLSGTSHAIVALAANFGAIMSGLPFSLVAKHYNWSAIFLLLEIVTFFTVILMIVGRNIPARIGTPPKLH
ncbi:unnamed protein product [Medioppia subpectinata]|uniref:Major facilitator superfamily (MFS) profile domain-containing protein n=1 Tax=Medioppia subpectinata TaxID=1979941 RepID=A0A7R9QBW9_9ACAR|nr:unnamed protein product [Medioppia subpectinata]CAG2118085.1 unnamed protein product [Medioppia subpectinata]